MFLLQLVALPALAQEEATEGPSNHWWLTAGLGVGSGGFAGVAGFDLAVDRHLLSLRGAATANVLGPGFWDLGLLYGRTVQWDQWAAGASVGLGIVGGDRSSGLGGSEPLGAHLGVPVAARMSWYPTSFAGLGAYLFGNFNAEQTFGGMALTVELGELR